MNPQIKCIPPENICLEGNYDHRNSVFLQLTLLLHHGKQCGTRTHCYPCTGTPPLAMRSKMKTNRN